MTKIRNQPSNNTHKSNWATVCVAVFEWLFTKTSIFGEIFDKGIEKYTKTVTKNRKTLETKRKYGLRPRSDKEIGKNKMFSEQGRGFNTLQEGGGE